MDCIFRKYLIGIQLCYGIRSTPDQTFNLTFLIEKLSLIADKLVMGLWIAFWIKLCRNIDGVPIEIWNLGTLPQKPEVSQKFR